MKWFNQNRWESLWIGVGGGDWGVKLFEELAKRYAEPHRHYHNAQHIDECLQEFDVVRGEAMEEVALALAIWFHDVVYDPRAADNEERSARFAVDCLKGGGEDLTRRVSDLILVTKTHVVGNHPDEALMIDIDLSILGKPPERFAPYEAGIRKEYAWVPMQVYAEKRAAILRGFLEREKIFTTPFSFNDLRGKRGKISPGPF